MKKISYALLISVFLFIFSACGKNSQNVTTTANLSKEEKAIVMYNHEVSRINALTSLNITSNIQKSTQIADSVFQEYITQKLVCSSIGSEKFTAALKEEILTGQQKTEINQFYLGGNTYLSVDGGNFYAASTVENFQKNYIPAVLLTIDKYRNVDVEPSAGSTVLHLSDAIQGEDWCLPENATLEVASGRIALNESGQLTESVYSAIYTIDTYSISITVTSTPDFTQPSEAPELPDVSVYKPIQSVMAPRILEESYGYLLQAAEITSQLTTNVKSEAFGLSHTRSFSVSIKGAEEDLSAQIETQVELIDFTRETDVSQAKQTEKFENGVYTLSTDDEENNSDASVTAQDMKSYCQDILIGNIILPKHILDATVTEEADAYRLEFTGSDELAAIITNNAFQSLYSNPEILDKISTVCETQALKYFIVIDRYTGLPRSAGLSFEGSHIIEDNTYSLTYTTDQTYTFPLQGKDPADTTQWNTEKTK